MSVFLVFLHQALDLAALAFAANRLLRATRFAAREWPVVAVAHALVATAVFAVWTLALGYAGQLFPETLSPALIVTAVAAGVWSRRRRGAATWRRPPPAGRADRRDRATTALAAGAVVVLALLALGGAVSVSMVPDDLSYRLPRIGIWIEHGSLQALRTDDPRINYMPVLADLVQWWICARFDTGFPGVPLAGWWGGVLTVLATVAAARLVGCSRFAGLAAALLAVLVPPMFAQFFTAQTDLFTAGLLAAGGYFLVRHGRTRRVSWLGALGVGLAFAAKPTPIYFAPVVALTLGVLCWRRRPRRRGIVFQTAAVAVCVALFAGPKVVQNLRVFGLPVGPADMVDRHAEGESRGSYAGVLVRNLGSWSVHNLDPNSNPAPLREPLRRAATGLARTWFDTTPNDGVAFVPGRRQALLNVFGAQGPEADTPSFGLLFAAASLLATALALPGLRSRARRPKKFRGVLALLVVGWFAVMLALAWHPFGYRYCCLVVPMCALLVASRAESLGRLGRPALLGLVAWQIAWAAPAVWAGYQYGPGIVGKNRGATLRDYLDRQGEMVDALPANVRRVVLATRYQGFTLGFFRTPSGRSIAFRHSADFRARRSLGEFAEQNDCDAVIVSPEDCPAAPLEPGWAIRQLSAPGLPILGFAILFRTPEPAPGS